MGRGTLASLVVLTLLSVSLGFLSFERKLTSFTRGAVSLRTSAGTLEVVAIDRGRFDQPPLLAPGDRIVLAGGEPVVAAAALEARLAERGAIGTLVVLRRGQPMSIAWKAPRLALDVQYLALAFIGFLYLVVGAVTLTRERSRTSVLFYALTLASFVLYVFSPSGATDGLYRILYFAEEVARVAVPGLLVHFFLVFPRRSALALARPPLVALLYAPGAALAAVHAWLLSGANGARSATLVAGFVAVDRLQLALMAVGFLGAAALVTHSYVRARRPSVRKQIKWISLGVTAGLLPFVLLYALPYLLDVPAPALRTLAVVPLAFVPLAFAYSILRYRLWNIEVIFKDVLSYSVTVVAGLAGFALINVMLTHALAHFLAPSKNFISFTSGLLLAGMLVPMKRRIETLIDRLQYRETFRQRRAVEEFSRELSRFETPDALFDRLFERLGDALRLERQNLLLSDGARLRPFRREDGPEGEGAFDSAQVERLAGSDAWGSVHATGLAVAEGSAALRLYRLGYRYAFPLRVKERLLGTYVTGFKEEGVPLNRDDIDLVASVMSQVALALENAKLYGQLSERLAEVQRLKEYLESIIESSAAGIAVVDDAGAVVSANQAFCALVGRTRAALAGVPLPSLLDVRWPELAEQGHDETQVAHQVPGGGEVKLTLSLSRIRGDASGPGAALWVVLANDVTRRMELERELKDKERLASLGMLAAGVAHEVNTPITGISSYAQMLLADTSPDDPRYLILKKMEKQSFRAANIVNSLLDFARDRRGEERPFDLVHAVAESVTLTEELMAERRVEVTADLPSEPIGITGSEGQLQQVFVNILINARDACERGGHVRVAVGLRNGHAEIAFTDDGRGMEEEERAHVFEPFFSTKIGKGGTGLGLSLSYDIVRKHGGTIEVDSRPGEGSTFRVLLPH